MNEPQFKTLAVAREEGSKLWLELTAANERLAKLEPLEAENSDLKTLLESAQKAITESADQIATRDAAINAKDEEIKVLNGSLSVLTSRCADLEKTQKSVKAQARELVAASAGPPAPVDNSEMEMTEADIGRAMASTRDQTKINALYRQLQAQRAANKQR
jgi:chromosome segregation ATPase